MTSGLRCSFMRCRIVLASDPFSSGSLSNGDTVDMRSRGATCNFVVANFAPKNAVATGIPKGTQRARY